MTATGLRQGVGDCLAPTFSRSESGTYLVDFVAIPGGALGLRASLCGIARSDPHEFPSSHALLSALRPQVPALERAQPPLVCQVDMPWSRPGGEGWRASKSS